MASQEQRYRVFVSSFEKFDDREGEEIEEELIDESTREAFKATVVLSRTPQEEYFPLTLEFSGRSSHTLEDKWFVRIVSREDEDEAGTVFQGMRLGQRRGYMLRSMLQEDKDKLKKQTMTTELEARLKRKQALVEELRKQGKSPQGRGREDG